MPKIGIRVLNINGARYEFELWYGTNKGRTGFYPKKLKDYDAVISTCTTLDDRNTGFPSEEKLIGKLNELYRKYLELNTYKRKVIVIDLKISDELYTKKGNYFYKEDLKDNFVKFFNALETKKIGSVSGYGISIDYDVLWEVKIQDKTRYYYVNKDDENVSRHFCGGDNDTIVVDYSEKKEAFLKTIIEGMSVLAYKFMEFFFDGDIALKLESKNNLLLTDVNAS